VPIIRKEEYNSEIKQILIRGERYDENDKNPTVDDCIGCRNFTVNEELEYIFNG
jgi:hypothetical protein